MQLQIWLNWWKVSDEDRTKVFRLLHDAFVHCGKSDEASEIMIKMLEGYTEENAAHARDDAIK